jgi:hypothetical protein
VLPGRPTPGSHPHRGGSQCRAARRVSRALNPPTGIFGAGIELRCLNHEPSDAGPVSGNRVRCEDVRIGNRVRRAEAGGLRRGDVGNAITVVIVNE